ncbi:rare lipoprotein A [Polaromonas sp. YR568]|uniref:septal ring lytic transglycosylase RlpA family protein n=1 Tax=Polaromonas sp. YR568 TaxID=1855301 RepID=UPI0008E57098|nr:rare lipoprotein A [Polaromonas sp. YR568]
MPDAPADEVPAASSELPRPELLAGEVPREFQRGTASWYGPRFNGRRTASGERFDMTEFTAAHRTLPFGTMVRVHSLVNGRDVDVRITDRGPYAGNRIIDLSRAAAEELGMLGLGFKEVVLLVPESTPEVAVTPPPVKKRPRPVRRAAPPKAR